MNIQRAITLVASVSDTKPRISKIFESEPWGFISENPFLNVGIEITTDMSPSELIDRLQAIEKKIDPAPHRNISGEYVDRSIDIDLIFYGSRICQSEKLTLPHPRLHLRDFVLIPLLELSPQWIHPSLNLSVKQMINNLKKLTNHE